ncbi:MULTISPECIES: hypothetical protein [unclassified Moorena]|nr:MULTISPECIES: hypothetical protein [unclassified Moorena]
MKLTREKGFTHCSRFPIPDSRFPRVMRSQPFPHSPLPSLNKAKP